MSESLDHGRLVADLRALRTAGLPSLRTGTYRELARAAEAIAPGEADLAFRIEGVLTRAAAGDGEEPETVRRLFGLEPGTRTRGSAERRRQAAEHIDATSAESFRKREEPALIDWVAGRIQRLAAAEHRPEPNPHPVRTPDDDLRRLRERYEDQSIYHAGRFGPYRFAGHPPSRCSVTVDAGQVEELNDVAVLVSSENTYLQPARMFTNTLSGQLRKAAAFRDEAGRILIDVVNEGLAAWTRENPTPVMPGVVVPTDPGRLGEQGVRRILHAAIAIPRETEPGFQVPVDGVNRAVARCFELARQERDLAACEGDPTLVDSISLPLFGAGDGGLAIAASATTLWAAVRVQLERDPSWHVHLTTWTVAESLAVLSQLSEDCAG
jgi:hypothetical protein